MNYAQRKYNRRDPLKRQGSPALKRVGSILLFRLSYGTPFFFPAGGVSSPCRCFVSMLSSYDGFFIPAPGSFYFCTIFST